MTTFVNSVLNQHDTAVNEYADCGGLYHWDVLWPKTFIYKWIREATINVIKPTLRPNCRWSSGFVLVLHSLYGRKKERAKIESDFFNWSSLSSNLYVVNAFIADKV